MASASPGIFSMSSFNCLSSPSKSPASHRSRIITQWDDNNGTDSGSVSILDGVDGDPILAVDGDGSGDQFGHAVASVVCQHDVWPIQASR